jgi:hypothetical protein
VTRAQLLEVLRGTSSLPAWAKGRTIYEAGSGVTLRPSGRFYIDFASFAHGTAEEVPRDLIDALEADGTLRRAFPDHPKLNAWALNEVNH